jgi:hypothetical protein
MAEIRVEWCCTDYRADERPLRFVLRGRSFEVAEVEDRWYSPGNVYFRVRANDGNFYILCHVEGMDAWSLDGFRASRDADAATPLVAAGEVVQGPHGAS